MGKTILITGANGAIGRELVQKYLESNSYGKVVALAHSSVEHLPLKNPKLQIIFGDITKRNLALRKEDLLIVNQVDELLHCAANVKFNLTRKAALKINFQGVVNVINFIKMNRALKKVGFLSTSYIAGKRTGTIYEDDLEHNAGFVNTYEESKYLAEVYIKKNLTSLPFNIYRLGIVVCKSYDGRISQFNAVHFALKLYYHNLVPFIPAAKDVKLDFVSAEYASQAIFEIFSNYFIDKKTYHIVSGKDKSIDLKELIELTAKAFKSYSPRWKKKEVEKPILVDSRTYNLFRQAAKDLDNRVFIKALNSMDTFAPQLLYPKQFDTENTSSALRRTTIKPLSVRNYFENVLKFCLETNWGKITYERKYL